MAPGEADVFQRLLDFNAVLGAHKAEIEALKLADRDVRVEVTRLGDRVDAQIGSLRAELKGDIERLAQANSDATASIIAKIEHLNAVRDDKLAESIFAVGQALSPKRTDGVGDFIAVHWKALGVLLAAIGFAIFGAGVRSGQSGLTPERMIEQGVQ